MLTLIDQVSVLGGVKRKLGTRLLDAAEIEHLRFSMKSFGTFIRIALLEAGHVGPIGFVGPAQFVELLSHEVGDSITIASLEDMESRSIGEECSAILLFHCLEREPDASGLLARCRRLLSPNGRLFIVAFDSDSLHCLMRPSEWRGLQLQDQLYCYSVKTLSRLLRSAGFRPVRSAKSGVEVFGKRVDIPSEAVAEGESGFASRMKQWCRAISRQAIAIESLGSVLLVEAAARTSSPN